MTALQLEIKAPDFKLHSTPDQEVSLTDFKGTACYFGFFSGRF